MNCCTKLTLQQCNKMLEMQNSINSYVNPNWKSANNDWTLAILVETVEAIEHHGWKWWKHQKPDTNQLRMELIDIWHFMMSHTLCQNDLNTVKETAKSIIILSNNTDEYQKYSNKTCIENLKLFATYTAIGIIDYTLFFVLCDQVGLSVNMLFEHYIGKNVLNRFRQDNGYKKGTYIKIWKDGREDNEHLMDYLKVVDLNDENVDVNLYKLLAANYG